MRGVKVGVEKFEELFTHCFLKTLPVKMIGHASGKKCTPHAMCRRVPVNAILTSISPCSGVMGPHIFYTENTV